MVNVQKPDAIPNKEYEQTSQADTGNLTKTQVFFFVFCFFRFQGGRGKQSHTQTKMEP